MLDGPAHVVVVEDEELTRSLLVTFLEREGFRVSQAADRTGLRESLDAGPVDVVLLDIELPGPDGFSLVGELRARSNAGVIFLTRRGTTDDRVRGLELGGDDYVVKPPDLRELAARIRAVLRRRGNAGDPSERRRFAGFTLHPERRCMTDAAGHEVALSPAEVTILARLLSSRGEVVSRDELAGALARAGVQMRSLDVLLHRLRRKLGEGGNVAPKVLLSVYGSGYRIAEPVA